VAEATPRGTRRILDTSGDELRAGLAAGGWFLVKPSESELEHIAGRDLRTLPNYANAAHARIVAGQTEWVAVTLGTEGALLVSAEGAHFLPAVPVETRSAVGAGDSFLAGLVLGLVRGQSPLDAFRLATAAGAATATTPGTDLCHPPEVEALLRRVGAPEPVTP
jgi:6-phosphofructokinase 2